MKSRFLSILFAVMTLALFARPVFAAGVVIAWDPSDDSEVAGYIVKYGTQPRDYSTQVDVGRSTTFKADGLVEGQTYYFTVQAYSSTGKQSAPATELPAVVAGRGQGPARLTAPEDGQTGVTSAQTFMWEARPQAQAYRLQIGTKPGASDVLESGETARTSWTVEALPAGRTLYARLQTRIGNRWLTSDSQFVSADRAMLIYPYAGVSDVSASETFVWSGVSDAKAYRLTVGTTAGASDIADSGETHATRFEVSGVEPGQTLYARVATKLGDNWVVDAVTFTTATASRFTRPLAADGSDLGSGLAWTTILGANSYYVRLGSTPDGQDLLDSGEVKRTELETPALPAGETIYARISTNIRGQWEHRTTTLTLAGAALVAPVADANGAVAVDAAGQLLTWTTISNAEAYRVYVGTTPGAQDLLDSGELHETSTTVRNLPNGRRVFVTVWTKAHGTWDGTASSFMTK
jgi:hypothetical protein